MSDPTLYPNENAVNPDDAPTDFEEEDDGDTTSSEK
jgi:hypothetical protein